MFDTRFAYATLRKNSSSLSFCGETSLNNVRTADVDVWIHKLVNVLDNRISNLNPIMQECTGGSFNKKHQSFTVRTLNAHSLTLALFIFSRESNSRIANVS